MNLEKINNVDKLLLNINDIAKLLSISKESAKVTAARYVKKGILIRVKRDLYITKTKFVLLKEEELFQIANLIQTPSYVSLTTALSYYEITTQQQRNFIESVVLKRSKNVIVSNVEFTFTKIKKELYEGFELKNTFFIAEPEKALADAIYLTSLKRYNCDFEAIDFNKVNKNSISAYLENTNKRTMLFWANLCKTYKI
ncbi:hypothetical protein BMS3Abin04_00964 [bacterium BMS3Abin04]|nr:hypothetical protein BMS3Abin04_00964 [bacterium BMS3Abin04]